MAKPKRPPAPIAINLYVPAEAIRAIDRWLGWRVYQEEITMGEASRSAEVERVIVAEAARVRKLRAAADPLPRTEGDTIQINQRIPAEVVEALDAYAQQQQRDHGHSLGTISRSKLIYAALLREADRLTAELEKQERKWKRKT